MLVHYKRGLLQTRFFILGFLLILIIFMVILIYSKDAFSFDLPITWDENEEENGFEVESFYSDVAGKPFSPESADIAVVARK